MAAPLPSARHAAIPAPPPEKVSEAAGADLPLHLHERRTAALLDLESYERLGMRALAYNSVGHTRPHPLWSNPSFGPPFSWLAPMFPILALPYVPPLLTRSRHQEHPRNPPAHRALPAARRAARRRPRPGPEPPRRGPARPAEHARRDGGRGPWGRRRDHRVCRARGRWRVVVVVAAAARGGAARGRGGRQLGRVRGAAGRGGAPAGEARGEAAPGRGAGE